MRIYAIITLVLACALGWLPNAAAQDGDPYDEQDKPAAREIPQSGAPASPADAEATLTRLAAERALEANGAIIPPRPVAVPATPSTSAPAAPVVPDEIRLNFNNAPLSQVLDYFGAAAGFIISVAPGATVNGTVNLQSYGRSVTRDEAYEALNMALANSSVAILRKPGSRLLQIVSNTDRTNPLIPTRVIKTASDVARSEEVITAIIPVEYLSVTELNNNLAQVLPTSAVLLANQGANAVIMVDKQSTISRVVEIIKSLDKPLSSGTKTVVIPLKNADATTVSAFLADLLAEPARPSGTGTAISGSGRGGSSGGGPGGGAFGSGFGGNGGPVGD